MELEPAAPDVLGDEDVGDNGGGDDDADQELDDGQGLMVIYLVGQSVSEHKLGLEISEGRAESFSASPLGLYLLETSRLEWFLRCRNVLRMLLRPKATKVGGSLGPYLGRSVRSRRRCR